MWAGIAGIPVPNEGGFEVAISIHDSVYNTDFNSTLLPYTPNDSEKQSDTIETHVISSIRKFQEEHFCKFLGAGVTLSLLREVRFLNPPFRSHLQFPIFTKKSHNVTCSHPTFVLVFGLTWMSFPSFSTSNLSTPMPSLALTSSTVSPPPLALMFLPVQRPPLYTMILLNYKTQQS